MKTIEKELKNFNFPEILIDLNRNRKTGTLTIDTGEVVKNVYLEKGKAVFASSTDEDDRLGETLIKLGKITIDQYERSVALLKETGKRQGTILVELGYLTPKDLVLGVKSQVREIIYSLFDVEYAEYEFDESELPKREVITLQMGMGDLIYEGMKRIDNVVRIKRDMPQMNAVLRLRDDKENILHDIALNHRDQSMLSLIDGKRTVKKLVDTAPNGTFEAMKILYILFITGIVEEQHGIEPSIDQPIDQNEPVLTTRTEEETFEERVNDMFSNLYNYSAHVLLGIDEASDTRTVQNNYYRLVKEFHPDQSIASSDPIILDKLIAISDEIQNAYALLREDNKRKEYFESLGKNLRGEEDKTHEEEHFKSELSRASEEILSLRNGSEQVDTEEDRKEDALNSISVNPRPAFSNHTNEEPFKELTPMAKDQEHLPSDAEDNSDINESIAGYSDFVAETERPQTLLDCGVEEKVEIPVDQIAYEVPYSDDRSIEDVREIYQDEHTNKDQSPEVCSLNAEPEEVKPEELVPELEAETGELDQKEDVHDRRRHERFKVDDCEMSGELFCAREIAIIDISISGIALRIDRQLRVGREYLLNLHNKDKFINVKGEVVRSALISSKTGDTGDIIPEYMVGIEFKDASQEVRNELADFINNYKIDDCSADAICFLSGTRVHGRFHIDQAGENILNLRTSYQLKVLSLSGMLIETEQSVTVNDALKMNLSLSEDQTVNVLGRIVSCRATKIAPERFDVAVEFIEIPDEDREKLIKFLQVISDSQESVLNPDKTEDLNAMTPEESHTNVNETCEPSSSVIMESNSEKPRETFSQETVNNQLLELIGEIKSLLTQLRSEIPVGVAHTVSTVDKATEAEEPGKPLSESSYEPEETSDDVPEHVFQVSQEEYEVIPAEVKGYLDEPKQETPEQEVKVEPQKVQPAKRNLKLWHILIPVLFLLAAAASFFIIYTPMNENAVSQPVQAKKEKLPAVNQNQIKETSLPVSQKTPEIQPLPTPEAKKTAGAGAVQAVQHTIELIATESTWLSATIDEKSSKEMILKAGDKVKWTAKKNVSLIIGNAAGLKVIFDGKEMNPLGGQGKVVRLKLPSAGNS